MRARPLLILAFRAYTWGLAAACAVAAGLLAVLAIARPVEIAEGSALLLAVSAGLILLAVALIALRRLAAIAAILGAGAYALWLLAVDAGGTAPVVAVLAAVVLLEAAALVWLRP